MMTLSAQIRNRIASLPIGKIFGYADLEISKADYQTAAKVLERLQTKGLIKKLSKGVFYKPEQTPFGELRPDYDEQLRNYLFVNDKREAYETGFSLYNRMGLTTQTAFRIQIASRSKRIFINRGSLKATAVKSYAEVTESNYEILGYLDALKDIKRIPDTSVSKVVKIISGKIKLLTAKQIVSLMEYALCYPPRVRALVGAIMESLQVSTNTDSLMESLNPFTKIKLGLNETDLPNIKKWNIE